VPLGVPLFEFSLLYVFGVMFGSPAAKTAVDPDRPVFGAPGVLLGWLAEGPPVLLIVRMEGACALSGVRSSILERPLFCSKTANLGGSMAVRGGDSARAKDCACFIA